MPAPWVSWKRVLSCKQDSHLAVHDPKGTITITTTTSTATTAAAASSSSSVSSKLESPTYNSSNGVHTAKKRKSTSSAVCCSNSCNNLKNVIHGNTKVAHRADNESPLSHYHYSTSIPHHLKFLREPTIHLSPLPEPSLHYHSTYKAAHLKKLSGCYDCSIAYCEPPDLLSHTSAHHQSLARNSACFHPRSTCHKCGEDLDKPETLEEHHVTHHSVTELIEGDSARSIVEIIFQTSWLRRDIPCAKTQRIFKVHNSPKTVAKFEEYRDTVRAKASKVSKRHSRCLADGNELLRFYGTTISCHMGKARSLFLSSSSSSLCTSASCGVCHILRHGFPTKGQPGIYTNASSGKAHGSMFAKEFDSGEEVKRAMLVCRVIAGRIKKMGGSESSQDGSSSGYDSVAGDAAQYTDLEELLVFNTRAVLLCFIVIYSY